MRRILSSGTPVEIIEGSSERALVVVPDIWGLRPLFVDLAQMVANRTGWTVACIEPFPGQDLPGMDAEDGLAIRGAALRSITDDALLGDVTEAADLTGKPRVGVVGFCMGGMFALKAASTGRFDNAVSFYGMAHVQEAWQGPGQGDPVEMLGRPGSARAMELVGTEDPFVPSEHIDDLENAGVTVHRYQDAGHGFVHDPSRPAHRADYAEDAWNKALAFLAGE